MPMPIPVILKLFRFVSDAPYVSQRGRTQKRKIGHTLLKKRPLTLHDTHGKRHWQGSHAGYWQQVKIAPIDNTIVLTQE